MTSSTHKKMKCLTILEKDRIGLLADVTEELGKNNVNIDSISVDVTQTSQAIIKIMTASYQKAKTVLSKQGFHIIDSNAFLIRVLDRPGELAQVSKILSDAGISVSNVYVMERGLKKETICGIETNDNEKASKLLKDYL